MTEFEPLAPLPWQYSAWSNLTEQHRQGRPAHALLLLGSSGIGKRHLATALSYWLLCRQPQWVEQRPQACGQCRSCRQLASGVHPDFQWIEPEEADKPLKIDQVRVLSEFIYSSSQFGGYRIAVLDPAERLNLQAANALLKTLEEPPAQRLIILVAHGLGGLPATIRSRCQRLNLSRPSTEQVLPWLATQLTQRSGARAVPSPELVLSVAAGAPLRALALMEGDELAQRRACFAEYQQVLQGRMSADYWANHWFKTPNMAVIAWLLGWQQDMIRLKLCRQSPPHLAHPDLAEPLRQLSQTLSTEQLFQHLAALQALPTLLASPINAPLQIAALLMRLEAKGTRF